MEGVAEDGDYDLTVTGTPAASLTATSVTLRGDSSIAGDLVADALTVSGNLDVDGTSRCSTEASPTRSTRASSCSTA